MPIGWWCLWSSLALHRFVVRRGFQSRLLFDRRVLVNRGNLRVIEAQILNRWRSFGESTVRPIRHFDRLFHTAEDSRLVCGVKLFLTHHALIHFAVETLFKVLLNLVFAIKLP